MSEIDVNEMNRDVIAQFYAHGGKNVSGRFVDTDLNQYVKPEMRHAISAQSPAKRWGTADEVAQLIVFLATGPGFITGENVVIDGGIRNVYFVPPGFEK